MNDMFEDDNRDRIIKEINERLNGGVSFFKLVQWCETIVSHLNKTDYIDSEECRKYEFILKHTNDLCFPQGDIRKIDLEMHSDHTIFNLESSFFGLSGTVSPLSSSIAEYVACSQDFDGTSGMFEIIEHRLLSMFVQLYGRYHWGECDGFHGKSTWSKRLRGWIAGTQLEEDGWDLTYLPFLAGSTCNALHVKKILEDIFYRFEIKVSIHWYSMVGGRVWIRDDEQTKLNIENNQLGKSSIIGKTVHFPAKKCRIVVHPHTFEDFKNIISTDDLKKYITRIMTTVVSPHVDWEILIQMEEPGEGACLNRKNAIGVDFWIGYRPEGSCVSWFDSSDTLHDA